VPITDCGIPVAADDPAYTSGLAAGVFIRDTTGQPYLGQVRFRGWETAAGKGVLGGWQGTAVERGFVYH
jgi:hypothetical protein